MIINTTCQLYSTSFQFVTASCRYSQSTDRQGVFDKKVQAWKFTLDNFILLWFFSSYLVKLFYSKKWPCEKYLQPKKQKTNMRFSSFPFCHMAQTNLIVVFSQVLCNNITQIKLFHIIVMLCFCLNWIVGWWEMGFDSFFPIWWRFIAL